MLTDLFYTIKPAVPRFCQIALRRAIAKRKRHKFRHLWPIDPAAGGAPVFWPGWPAGKRFALVLTHDVESLQGHSKCLDLAMLEKHFGFKSSFNFVPERYCVSADLRKRLLAEGFEVGVHGLRHDGKLYRSRRIFRQRAEKINSYIKEWGASGFRSPAMHHKEEWLPDLDVDYDSSTFDCDPFEPQPDGAGTIFPFVLRNGQAARSVIELPCTLPQDHCLFVILQEKSIDIWKEKADWIAEKGGMVLVNTHPDYMRFEKGACRGEEYPVTFYSDLLNYLNECYAGDFWHALPRDVASFVRSQWQPGLSSAEEQPGEKA